MPEGELAPKSAYVINAGEYPKEYKVLLYSQRYELVDDPTQADLRIDLQPMEALPLGIGCVTPQFTVAAFTLGFYPVTFTEGYYFRYLEYADNVEQDVEHTIFVDKRLSWFDLFSFRKSRKKALGRSLQQSKNDVR